MQVVYDEEFAILLVCPFGGMPHLHFGFSVVTRRGLDCPDHCLADSEEGYCCKLVIWGDANPGLCAKSARFRRPLGGFRMPRLGVRCPYQESVLAYQ
jgi:hypothetical protein